METIAPEDLLDGRARGGQAQRLAVARVLLARPDVLLLVEATFALNPTAESEMLALIIHDLPNAAVICVAHRPPEALKVTLRSMLSAPYTTCRWPPEWCRPLLLRSPL